MSNEKFSDEVAEKLQYYVYRLIDPRVGETFYVGRGQGNRVFSHAAGVPLEIDDEDADDLKVKRIRAIKNDGFEVQHIIHRHGLTKAASEEVEAALIDVYSGLMNLVKGKDSNRGAMHASQIIRLYEAPEADFQHPMLLVNVGATSEEKPLYDAVRYAWRLSPSKANQCRFVLAVQKGLVIGAFEPEGPWLPAIPEYFPGFPEVEGKRFGFRGREASKEIQDLYVYKRVPEAYRARGAANPIRYVP